MSALIKWVKQRAMFCDAGASAEMPNIIGTYDGARAGARFDIADWGEVALAVSAVVAVAFAAMLVADDSTEIGVLDDPLLAPVSAWLAAGGGAIGSRILVLLTSPAMQAGAASCPALK